MNYVVYHEVMDLINDVRDKLISDGTYSDEAKHHLDERSADIKRKHRKWLKEKYKPQYLYGGKIVAQHWDYDSGYRKLFFANQHWSDEEKEDFADAHWRYCRKSPYDCTGDIFTWAIDCFNVPSGVVVYIREAMDV